MIASTDRQFNKTYICYLVHKTLTGKTFIRYAASQKVEKINYLKVSRSRKPKCLNRISDID